MGVLRLGPEHLFPINMRGYGLAQVARELATLTFARVTNVRVTRAAGDIVTYYYGFSEDLGDTRDPRTVWFKKMTHVCDAGRPGLFVGPVTLAPAGVPRKNDVVVGHVTDSAKGPVFEWWCHGAAPLWAFARAVTAGHVRADAEGELGPDLWDLARLVVTGDVTVPVAPAFAWHAAEFARCPDLFRHYVRHRGAGPHGNYTVDQLTRVLENT